MTYPITYQIENGSVQVTATKEGSNYNFSLSFSDGRNTDFGYTEHEPNKIQLDKPVTDRCQYHAMVALWQLQLGQL